MAFHLLPLEALSGACAFDQVKEDLLQGWADFKPCLLRAQLKMPPAAFLPFLPPLSRHRRAWEQQREGWDVMRGGRAGAWDPVAQ